jgi:hypothetical protein
MSTHDSSISLCRHCQHYLPEGRRGGHCSQLNVDVKSQWQACSLAVPPFRPSWERLKELMLWQQKVMEAQDSVISEVTELSTTTKNPETPQLAPMANTVSSGSGWAASSSGWAG